MAFVSQITLSESVYESPFSLSFTPDGKVRGIYYPTMQDEDKKGLISAGREEQTFLTGGGLAIMTGEVIYRVGNASLIRGDWKHVVGPREAGKFELLVNGSMNSAVGYWTDAESDVKHEWILGSRDLGLASTSFDVDLIMERWGIASAWLFLIQTIISTLLFALEAENASKINMPMHIVYTIAYISFLAYYEYTDAMPSVMYMFGVLLYTVGYGFFADLYNLALDGQDGTSSYVAGSLMFALGSFLLVYALWECRISRLLSGSALFLTGSVAFTIDSLAYYPKITKELCYIGYITFVIGRLCFLFGSQTKRCDIFFRNSTQTPDKKLKNNFTNNPDIYSVQAPTSKMTAYSEFIE